MAKNNLELMLTLCAKGMGEEDEDAELQEIRKKAFHEVTHELVRRVTAPNSLVREQVTILE
jgi:hypothetical protein